MHKFKGGQKFGFLEIVGEDGRDKHGRCLWLCKCECGCQTSVKATYLVSGRTKSCGCQKFSGLSRLKHGLTGTKVYEAWKAMRQRCTNRKRPQYADWGGRGIKFDPNWMKFENFLADMGVPSDGESLDRIDNDGPYCKENCRWTIIDVQANNKRNNVLLKHNGERLSFSQWASKLGMNRSVITNRYYRGWPVEKVLDPKLYRRKVA
jgi:hypothetical protein